MEIRTYAIVFAVLTMLPSTTQANDADLSPRVEAASTTTPVFVAGVDAGGAGAKVTEGEQLLPGNLINSNCIFVVGCSACVHQPNDWCNFAVCNAGPC